MEQMQAKNFLGVGWKFPICVDPATGRIAVSEYETDIAEAIRIIIMTRKGERMMQPEFGCDLQEQVFSGTGYTALTQMADAVQAALTAWEPRITDIQVEVQAHSADGGQLSIHVSYVVRATNNPFNQVYPYYLQEGIGES